MRLAQGALQLLQEVANRRLFSVVRERKQLTYDANFHFSDHERLHGGWFLISVTASPANAEKALQACRETLQGLDGPSPATPDNLEAARRTFAKHSQMVAADLSSVNAEREAALCAQKLTAVENGCEWFIEAWTASDGTPTDCSQNCFNVLEEFSNCAHEEHYTNFTVMMKQCWVLNQLHHRPPKSLSKKSLFRALKAKHDTPKYGLIYHASLVGQAAPKHKGKRSEEHTSELQSP